MASTPPPLVWVTQGKSQHAAYLLETRGTECLIRWNSTNEIALVPQHNVAHALTPRRRQRPVIHEQPLSNDENLENQSMIMEETHASAGASEKRKTPPRENDNADSDHDDEVQVLLTILPPTPKRAKQKVVSNDESQTDAMDTGARRVSTSPQPNNDEGSSSFRQEEEEEETLASTPAADDAGAQPLDSGNDDSQKLSVEATKVRRVSTSPRPNNASEPVLRNNGEGTTFVLEQDNKQVAQSAGSVMDNDQKQPAAEVPVYSFQSSAYVQNLAEICYTILNDARWRAEGTAQKRLFAWEQGDDLSAVCMLSKVFELPKRQGVKKKCPCLLCRDEEKGEEGKMNQQEDKMDEVPSSEHVIDASQPEIDEEAARALYLYSRLYYRKGPWFRLDKLYTSYYAPAEDPSSSQVKQEESDTQEQESNDVTLRERRNSFFERSSSSQLSTGNSDNGQSKKRKKDDDVIDQGLLEERISEIALMLRDVDHLHAIGLIRSFHDEEECGKTAGSVTPEGYGVLLRADERRAIVDKLGGRGKKDTKRRASTVGQQASPRENIIWNQMCQQRSISFVAAPGNGTRTKALLPVCRHVDDALLDKLATSVVYESSRVDYVPAAILRPAMADVKARILGLLRPGSRSISMCLKLREAPLLTLRRCVRLFLCATCGPGDMRGNGTNSWRSLSEFDTASIHPDIPLPTDIQPPGSYSWYRVLHPSLSHRFGIASFSFIDAHEFVQCENYGGNNGDINVLGPSVPRELLEQPRTDTRQQLSWAWQAQVFETVDAFRLWELCVEVRAHVDYHLELFETLAYHARRRARELDASEENHEPTNGDDSEDEEAEDVKEETRCSLASDYNVALDFLDLLTVVGRKTMINKLVVLSGAGCVRMNADDVCEKVESTLSELGTFIDSEKKRSTKTNKSSNGDAFQYDSERIVVFFAVIISHVLIVRNQCITSEELASKQARPWLRHLWWEGILAYALWDCIPVLERKGFYELACSCLEVLLFGKKQNRERSLASDEAATNSHHFDKTSLSELLVSRRTRGKAHERLMIDYVHLLRWESKTCPASSGEDSSAARGKKTRQQDASIEVSPQDAVRRVCSRVVGVVARAGSIPFSAVRTLARKMKRPLARSLEMLPCTEVDALGIRLDNGRSGAAATTEDAESKEMERYIDWIPPTDFAVANAMAGEETLAGKRCSYVGFEDDTADKADTSSLNVEELAMQYYATGRLPVTEPGNDELSGGGWVGWHDEGGHVRALFRILCAHPILGMGSGCGKESASTTESLERLTIHLTPYQGAPFDLHVAHWQDNAPVCDTDSTVDSTHETVARSFYQRRRMQIDCFLSKLESLSDQELSDLVYDSIVCRLGQGRSQDAFVARDLQQVRSLSMLAAGFGGQQLSAMFRCLLFDYRHYSGGLPDLLLARALTAGDSDAESKGEKHKSLVDLGGWVGEEFSTESKMEKETLKRSNLLIDKDDEFLGCTKVGDSGGQSSSRWRRGAQKKPKRDDAKKELNEFCFDNLPPRLVLRHNDLDVQVQCLFVEVKSQNDRLDGRQEDWLNVLDRVGNARVCKFGRGKKKSTKGASAKAK